MKSTQSRGPIKLALPLACLLMVTLGCGGVFDNGGGSPFKTASGFVEGKDYIVLERVRLLDEMGFDQPVEAMSVLVPRGWKTEGGVKWKRINECRGEIVTSHLTATSPDGTIKIVALPARTFVFHEDQMLQQAAIAGSRQGGCEVSEPFDAKQYLEKLARTELGGATVSNIRKDESLQAVIDKVNAGSDATSQQYGLGMKSSASAVFGTLTWPDGSKGLANVGVTSTSKQSTDMFTGASNGFSTTSVFHRAYIRFPPEREAEAIKLYGTMTASSRTNPVWLKAKDAFLTKLGNIEHAGRMERIRLVGEQSAAYAKAQSDASDARMRDWESRQAASDASHHRFIQTIREVETWKTSSGSPVELSAGYSHGWSKPDGSFILTNNSLFDPAVEFQQPWTRMEKPPN